MNGLRFCRTRGGIRVSPALLVLAAFMLTATSSVRGDVVGACCLDDGTCQDDLDPISCAYAGGRFMGDGSVCEEVECPEYGECGWILTAPTVFSHTTVGQGDDCNWVSGSDDEQFEITIPYTGEWDFSLCGGATWNTVITLGTECCGFDLGFDDSGCPTGTQSLLHFDVLEAGTYFLNLEDVTAANGGKYCLIIRDHDADCEPSACAPDSAMSQSPHWPADPWEAPESDGAADQYLYENFLVPEEIREVRWWGFRHCYLDPMTFRLEFFDEVWPDQPDVYDPFVSYECAVDPVFTGCFYNGEPLWEFCVELEPCCVLTEGWISILAQSTQACCCFEWLSSPYGDGLSAT